MGRQLPTPQAPPAPPYLLHVSKSSPSVVFVGQTAAATIAIPTAERGTGHLGLGWLFSPLFFSFSFFAFSFLNLIVNLAGGDWKSERIHRVTRHRLQWR